MARASVTVRGPPPLFCLAGKEEGAASQPKQGWGLSGGRARLPAAARREIVARTWRYSSDRAF